MFTLAEQPSGRHAPVITCDHCGGTIRRHGNLEWLANYLERAVAEGPWTLHKRCSSPFRAARRGGEAALPEGLVWQWWELGAYLAAVVHNAAIDLAAAERELDLLDRLY